MGLCNLKYIDVILEKRREQWLYYEELFADTNLQMLQVEKNIHYNYAYFPVVFSSEETLLQTMAVLKTKNIIPRRYFFPSLNTLPYVNYQPCPVAEDIAKKVICLPLYHDITRDEQLMIANIILKEIKP